MGITHSASSRAPCTALWMAKPAGVMWDAEGITLRAWRSTLTSDDAVISSNIIPYGLIRKWCSGPGTRAEIWVNTRSSQPNSAVRRYAAARLTRASHSAEETACFRLTSDEATSTLLIQWFQQSGKLRWRFR